MRIHYVQAVASTVQMCTDRLREPGVLTLTFKLIPIRSHLQQASCSRQGRFHKHFATHVQVTKLQQELISLCQQMVVFALLISCLTVFQYTAVASVQRELPSSFSCRHHVVLSQVERGLGSWHSGSTMVVWRCSGSRACPLRRMIWLAWSSVRRLQWACALATTILASQSSPLTVPET